MKNSPIKAKTVIFGSEVESTNVKHIQLRPALFQFILSIEATQPDQLRKVYEWIDKQRSSPRDEKDLVPMKVFWSEEDQQGEDVFFAMTDALRIHVNPYVDKPKNKGRTFTAEEHGLEKAVPKLIKATRKGQINLLLSEFTTEIAVRLFIHTKRLFAQVEGEFVELESDDEILEQVRARDERQKRSIPDGFLHWLQTEQTARSRHVKFTDESLSVLPNTGADRDLFRGLMLYPKEWGINERRADCFYNGKEGHIVTYQPSEVERALGDAPDRALSALERSFKALKSETVADVIDILFHHWHTHKDGQTSAVMINAAKLCEYRGKVPEGDNLRFHWEALRDAFSFALRDTTSDINAKVFFAESKGENTDGPGARYLSVPVSCFNTL